MADDIIEGVNPTRMELLVIKDKISLAEKGHKLLKEKRDALAMEFMNYVGRAEESAQCTYKQVAHSKKTLTKAYATSGTFIVSSCAFAAQEDVGFTLGHRNVMGVDIPEISLGDTRRRADGRGFGLTFTPAMVDEAAADYEDVLSRLVEFIGIENALKILSEETLKTRRRVNSLERKVLPQLRNTEKYIRLRIEEINRENFFRLKVMKKKKEK